MEFTINKRLLTEDEKYQRAIFYYTYDNFDFDLEWEEDNPDFDDFKEPPVKIKENLDKLDEATKAKIYEFVKQEIYDETIDLKCLKCLYEEHNVDWEEIEENWDGNNYPKLYCPKCGKPQFVPIDIWNKMNKYYNK